MRILCHVPIPYYKKGYICMSSGSGSGRGSWRMECNVAYCKCASTACVQSSSYLYAFMIHAVCRVSSSSSSSRIIFPPTCHCHCHCHCCHLSQVSCIAIHTHLSLSPFILFPHVILTSHLSSSLRQLVPLTSHISHISFCIPTPDPCFPNNCKLQTTQRHGRAASNYNYNYNHRSSSSAEAIIRRAFQRWRFA